MLKLIEKWLSVVFSWLPYYRNKKRKAEEEAERRRIRYEQTLALKDHVLRFKPEGSFQSEWRNYRYWDFTIKTEEGRNEFYRLHSRLAPPPQRDLHCFMYRYQFGRDDINLRRFHALFRLVKTHPNGTFKLMGVDTIQRALEDVKDDLLISLEIVDENQKVVERILL